MSTTEQDGLRAFIRAGSLYLFAHLHVSVHGLAGIACDYRRGVDHRNEFIRTHVDMLVATDFFTTEVWTRGERVTYSDVLFFICLYLGSRRDHIAGDTASQCDVDDADSPPHDDGRSGFLGARTICDR